MLIVSYLGPLPRGTDRTRKPPGAVLCAFPTSSHSDPEKDTALEQRGGRGTFRQTLWVSQGQDHAPGVAASSPRNGFYPLNSLAGSQDAAQKTGTSLPSPGLGRRYTRGGPETGDPHHHSQPFPTHSFIHKGLADRKHPLGPGGSLKTHPEQKWADHLIFAGLFQGRMNCRKFSENVLLSSGSAAPPPAVPPPLPPPSSFIPAPCPLVTLTAPRLQRESLGPAARPQRPPPDAGKSRRCESGWPF